MNRLGRTHIGKDNMTVEVPIVHPLGRSIEVRTTAKNTLPNSLLALLPNVDLAIIYLSIEGDNREGGDIRKLIQFVEEQSKHIITNATRLIDRDSDVCKPLNLLACVNPREPLIDLADSGGLICTNGCLDEVGKHLTPIHVSLELFHNLLLHGRGNRSPIVRLRSFLYGVLEDFPHALLRDSLRILINVAPSRVVVKGLTESITIRRLTLTFALLPLVLTLFLILFLLLLESFEVEISRHFGRQVSERTLSGEATHLRNLVNNAREPVDCEVRSDIPELRHTLWRKTLSNVIEYKVIEFMHQNAKLLIIGELSHEFGIVEHFILSRVLIDSDASGRNGLRRRLMNLPRDSRKERLRGQKTVSVEVKVEVRCRVVVAHASTLSPMERKCKKKVEVL